MVLTCVSASRYFGSAVGSESAATANAFTSAHFTGSSVIMFTGCATSEFRYATASAFVIDSTAGFPPPPSYASGGLGGVKVMPKTALTTIPTTDTASAHH